MINRYVVVVEFYVWAEDDSQAIQKAELTAEELNKIDDSRAQLSEIFEQPFAQLGNRPINIAAVKREELCKDV